MLERRHRAAVALRAIFFCDKASTEVKDLALRSAVALKEWPWNDALQSIANAAHAAMLAASATATPYVGFEQVAGPLPAPSGSAIPTAYAERNITALVRRWVPGHEDLLDADAHTFWNGSDVVALRGGPHGGGGGCPFPSFLKALFERYGSGNGSTGSKATTSSPTLSGEEQEVVRSSLGLPNSVLRVFAQAHFGILGEVTSGKLQTLVDSSQSYQFPKAIVDGLRTVLDHVPPLDAGLGDLLQDEAPFLLEDGPETVMRTALALRDHRACLKDLAKLSSEDRREMLRSFQVPSHAAVHLDFAIYQRVRRSTPNDLQTLTKLERGVRQVHDEDLIVNLSRCQLTSGSLAPIVLAMREKRGVVREVDLRDNDLHVAGAKLVAGMLETTANVSVIRLGGNLVQCDGVKSIVDAIRSRSVAAAASQQHTSSKAAPISAAIGAAFLYDRNLSALHQWAPPPGGLRLLDVSASHLGVEGLSLCGELVASGLLQGLHVGANHLGRGHLHRHGGDAAKQPPHAASPLTATDFSFVANAPSLRELCLASNHFGDEALDVLIPALASNTSLLRLSLADNHFSAAGLQKLCATLQQHPCLAELDLSHNGVDAKDADTTRASLLAIAAANSRLRLVRARFVLPGDSHFEVGADNAAAADARTLLLLTGKPLSEWSADDLFFFFHHAVRHEPTSRLFDSWSGLQLARATTTSLEELISAKVPKPDQREVRDVVARVVERLWPQAALH